MNLPLSTVAAAALAAWSFAPLAVIAEPASVRAPVACAGPIGPPSCGADVALQQIEQKAAAARALFSGCAKTPGGKPCPNLAVDHNICSKNDPAYYVWAPAALYSKGADALRDLLDRARTGVVSGGAQIIESADSSAAERHLALCRVRVIAGAAGPPQDCVTVAVKTKSGAWLRGGYDQATCLEGASTRLSSGIDISFVVKTNLNVTVFTASLQKMLENRLQLETKVEYSTDRANQVLAASVTGTGGLRNSTILDSGWRESFDFDGWVSTTSAAHEIKVRGVIKPLVTREAVGTLTSYEGTNDQQRAQYASALNADVDASIKAVCANYVRLDDWNISCD